jgi:hypothetical protein
MLNLVFVKLPLGFKRLNKCIKCKICGSQISVTEDSSLQGCHTMKLDEWFPTFQSIIAPSTSGSSSPILLGLLDPKDEGTKILQDIRSYLPNDKVSHMRRPESSKVYIVLLDT